MHKSYTDNKNKRHRLDKKRIHSHVQCVIKKKTTTKKRTFFRWTTIQYKYF